jgi:phage terminase large subunit-like protein
MKFQRKFILDMFDNPHGTGRAYLSVARKNGKSALIAAILLAHLVGPEARQNSQIISGARSRDQASLVFKLAKKWSDYRLIYQRLCGSYPRRRCWWV